MSAALPISIIIPTRNRSSYLLQTLRDLELLEPRVAQVIIIDQSGQHEGGLEAEIAASVGRLGAQWCRTSSRGASRARNEGLQIATEEVVLFLDDDIRLPPDLALAHWRNYQSERPYDAVSGIMLSPDGARTDRVDPEVSLPHVGWIFERLNYSKRHDTINLTTCNGSVRRDLLLKVRGFDEQMPRFEDTDISWRLHLAGARCVYDPSAEVTHLLAPEGAVRDVTRRVNQFVLSNRDFWAALFYLVLKNFGWKNARPVLWWWLRHHVVRRPLLIRPWWFARATGEVLRGLRIAEARLREGPRYMQARISEPTAD